MITNSISGWSLRYAIISRKTGRLAIVCPELPGSMNSLVDNRAYRERTALDEVTLSGDGVAVGIDVDGGVHLPHGRNAKIHNGGLHAASSWEVSMNPSCSSRTRIATQENIEEPG